MISDERNEPCCPPDAAAISFTLLRHWAWAATELRAQRGFWALGEAVVDAVATRFPATFDPAAVG